MVHGKGAYFKYEKPTCGRCGYCYTSWNDMNLHIRKVHRPRVRIDWSIVPKWERDAQNARTRGYFQRLSPEKRKAHLDYMREYLERNRELISFKRRLNYLLRKLEARYELGRDHDSSGLSDAADTEAEHVTR